MSVALVVSPHLDDAAFSCGATMARLADQGWRCVLATVFTESVPDPKGFALACQLDKGLGPEVDYMALRRAEDAAAARLLGAEPSWLDLPEAPHRGYASAAALFGPVLDGDAVIERIVARLWPLISDLRPTLLLAPQALGGHVDHVQVVRALRACSSGDEPPVLWWRDLPYAIREPGCTPTEPLPGRPRDVAVDAAGGMARKIEACAAYASQIGFQFGGAGRMADALSSFARAEHPAGRPVERFMGSPRAAAVLAQALGSTPDDTPAGPVPAAIDG